MTTFTTFTTPADLEAAQTRCDKARKVFYREDGDGMHISASMADLPAALTALRQAWGQLPDGMKHCTILYKECEKGHGRLTATNWLDSGCPFCQQDKIAESLHRVGCQRDTAMLQLETAERERDEARRMLAQADQLVAAFMGEPTVVSVPLCEEAVARHRARQSNG
jgi:hypothetical protein